MADRNAYSINTPVLTPGQARKLTAIGGAVSLVTGDLALNKTTALFVAPAGFTVVHHVGTITDIDTNGSPAVVFTIGDATDADRFVTTSTAGQAGGSLAAIATTGVNYRFTADTEIVFTATTAAATAAAGTLTYFLFGYFD